MRVSYAVLILLLALINPVLCQDQETAEYWVHKGDLLFNLSNYYNESIEAYDMAIELNQSYAVAWSRKGNALHSLGKYDEAIKAYDEAIRLDHNYAAIWNNKGNDLNDQGKYDVAIKYFDKAIRLDPNDVAAWNNKGVAFDGQGKYGEAIQSYNKASSIDQTYRFSMTDLGSSHYNEGEYLAAIRYFDEAIKQDPKNEYVWYNKADTLRMLHRNSEAEAAYAKARELGYNGAMTLMEMTSK
jgi:tetratricopeptide (TPR) repeat protein